MLWIFHLHFDFFFFFFFGLLLNLAGGSVKRSVNIWVRGKKCSATPVSALPAIRTNTTQLLTHAYHPVQHNILSSEKAALAKSI